MTLDPTQTLNLIRTRRSINQNDLRPDDIPEAYIQHMLEAANWAPSHGKTEPWHFTVFTGQARRELGEALATSYKLGTPADKYRPENEEAQRQRVWLAPVWMIIGLKPSGKFPEWEEVAAVACAVQNASLIAASYGLGAYWASGMPTTHEHTARFAGLETPAKSLGVLYIGYPKAEYPQGTRKHWQEKVTWRR